MTTGSHAVIVKKVEEEIDMREGIRDLAILEAQAAVPLPPEAQEAFVEDQIREQSTESTESVSAFEGIEVVEQP